MHRHGLVIVACLLLLLPCAYVAAGPESSSGSTEVTGTVLDEDGKPVADIEVATYWMAVEGRWQARGAVRTDADGHFALAERLSRRARSIMALDAAQARGAVALLSRETAAKPIVLRLGRTTSVGGAYTCEALGHPIERTYVSFTAKPASIAVGSHMGAAAFQVRLPEGAFQLMVSGVDCQRIRQEIALTKDMRGVELGTTDLEPTIIAQHYGRPPPALQVADARGVAPDLTLASLRGKWVLLEFWGFW